MRFSLSPRLRNTLLVSGLVTGLAGTAAIVAARASAHRESTAPCAEVDHACALPSTPRADDGTSQLPPGPAVVEFTSEACPACRKLEPVLRAAREQCVTAGAALVPLDVESTEGGALATRLNVTGTPTLVLFDAGHHEVARLVGARSLADVRGALEQAYGIACAPSPTPPSPSG